MPQASPMGVDTKLIYAHGIRRPADSTRHLTMYSSALYVYTNMLKKYTLNKLYLAVRKADTL